MEGIKNAYYYKEESKKALLKDILNNIIIDSNKGDFVNFRLLRINGNVELKQFIINELDKHGFKSEIDKYDNLKITWDEAKES